jgi:hypothetical protein
MSASLEKIHDLVAILEAVDREAAGTCPTPECGYLLWTSNSMRELAAGYVSLRTSGYRYASKVLIRSIIELTFNAVAAFKDKYFLLNKAHSEYREEKKMPSDNETQAGLAAEFASIQAEWTRIIGPASPQSISVFQTAQKAGLESMYETAYRAYCKYSHGALRAQGGHYDEFTDSWDDRWVCNCLRAIALCLKEHTSFQLPDLAECGSRVKPNRTERV